MTHVFQPLVQGFIIDDAQEAIARQVFGPRQLRPFDPQAGSNITITPNAMGYSIASSAGSIPSGIIAMWSGLLVNIPVGWTLCDGTSGTPDLRDKFIRGAAAGADPGAMGGAATHTHAGHSNHVVTQPSNHVVTQPGAHSDHATQGAHTHDAHTTAVKTAGLDTVLTGPTTHSSDGGHAHDAHSAHAGSAVDAHGGTAVDAHSAHDSVSLLPTFFALAYIQKL